LLSGLSTNEIGELFQELSTGKIHPKKVKVLFAKEMVTRFHSKGLADQAEEHFEKVFSKKELPDVIPEFEFTFEDKLIWIPKLLVDLNFSSSTSEGKRLVAQGAVKINEVVSAGENLEVTKLSPVIIQCGKRKFAKVTFR